MQAKIVKPISINSTLLIMGVVFAPPFIGYLADISGSYSLSWFVSAVLIVLIGALFFALTIPDKKLLQKSY